MDKKYWKHQGILPAVVVEAVGNIVQGVPKKGFVNPVIVAPNIIFKLIPVLLNIRVILSYCGRFCNERFDFYGYFSTRGFLYFCQNYGLLPKW